MSAEDLPDYLGCFHTLGLAASENDWKRVRAAYRRLISEWHPDRIANSDLSIAEERAKAINAAYETLAEYYRANGHLPSSAQFDALPARHATMRAEAARAAHRADPETPTQGAHRSEPLHVLLRPTTWVLILAACGYLALHALTPDTNAPQPEPATLSSEPQVAPRIVPTERFTVGSTVGDVATLQGTPSRNEGNTWYYGKSTVTFEKGRVVAWREDPENPLRVGREPSHNPLEMEFYGVGSNRSTVRAIQGPPNRTEGNTWYYGSSKVHFSGDLVSSWEEDSLSPLRVRK